MVPSQEGKTKAMEMPPTVPSMDATVEDSAFAAWGVGGCDAAQRFGKQLESPREVGGETGTESHLLKADS